MVTDRFVTRLSHLLYAALVLLILVLVFNGCKTTSEIAQSDTITKTVVIETIRDTTVYISDSSGFRALLECDSLGQVRVKQITDFYAGQFVKPTIVIKDNFVNVACKIDSGAVYVAMKNRYESKEVYASTVVIEKVNYLTWWQWFQVYGFRVYAWLTVLAVLLFGVRAWLKTKVL
jgi:hypothetical protein